jgi:hypothetical protein
LKLEEVEAALYAKFGTVNPSWAAFSGSNAISFSAFGEIASLAVAVDSHQAGP